MTMSSSRWLIAVPAVLLREAKYLHVFEDGTTEWSADPQRALRFATRHEAERFGVNHLLTGFHAEEWASADLVVHTEDEADEDTDADLAEAA